MPKAKIKLIMFLALFMFVAKPFVGFTLRYEHFFKTLHHHSQNILVKSFTKRKLEFSEDSEFSMATISQKLANPVLPTLLLLAFALNVLLPRLFKSAKANSYNIFADAIYSLYPPQPLYLLGGKLTI